MIVKSRSAQRRRLAALTASIEVLEERRLLSESTTNYAGGTYSQNFDSLINTGSASSPPNPMDLSSGSFTVSGQAASMQGWNGVVAPLTSPVTWNATGTPVNRFSAGDGSSSTGSLYSFGNGTNSNRALGSVASGTNVSGYGVELINTTGSTITSFTVSYTGETFRIGDAPAGDANTLYFGYEIGNSGSVSISDSDASYTAVPSLYYGPITQATGNNAASSTPAGTPVDVTPITQTIAGISWGPNQVLILRWHDYNETGNDYGLAIDNMSFQQAAANPGTIGFVSTSYSGQEPTNGSGNNTNFVNFNIQRLGGATGAAIVDYAIPNSGTATQGVDYLAPAAVAATGTTGAISGGYSGTLTFLNGQTSATISVPIVDDSIPESTESFTMTLAKDHNDMSGFTLASAPNNSATGNIYDNDGSAPSGILLNELDVNPPGDGTTGHTDGPHEYVEIINSSGSTVSNNLNNLYLVSIEGDVNSNAGNITYVYPFSGTLNAGQIGILEANSGGPTPAGGALVFQDSQFDGTSGILQNGTNTFALVYSQTPLTLGTDLDTVINSSGTPSNYPETSTLQLSGNQSVVDSVGWHDKSATSSGDGTIYGAGASIADLTVTGIATGAATRIPGDTLANTASQWYYGALYTATNDPTSLTYDPSHVGGTFPAGGQLTPGGANYYNTITSGQIGLSATVYAVNESVSDPGTSDGSVTITVNRVAGTSGNVTVDYTLTPVTATPGSDYILPYAGTHGTLTFADGSSTAQTIVVPIFNDSIAEPSESFTVTLSNPQNTTTPSNAPLLGPATTATVNIGDDDTKLYLNEILANVPGEAGQTNGSDQNHEFVEFEGTPGQVIPANTYFLSVEGDSNSTIGAITYAFDLGGVTVGSNGLILLTSPENNLIPPAAPGTTVVNGDSFDSNDTPNGFNQSGGVLQNGTNSFLIVSSADLLTSSSNTNPGQSNDVDPNKDGTLDLSALGAHLVDGVGWTDGGSGDVAYGALLNFGGAEVTGSYGSPTPSEVAPSAGVRVPGTTDTPDLNSQSPASLAAASDWYYGDLVGTDTTAPATDDRLVFSSTTAGRVDFVHGGFSQDSNEHMTPGEVNYDTEPFVEIPTTVFGGGTTNPILKLDFSSNVSQNISTSNMTLTNIDTSMTYGGLSLASLSATDAFANGYVETLNLPTTLPQGHYKLTINSGLTDDFSVSTSSAINLDFTVVYGDANGDGIVNALDFNALATNYGTSGNYSQGNFDYTGTIGSNDFDILAANFGTTIPAPALEAMAAPTPDALVPAALPNGSTSASSLAASSASLFSNTPISAGSLAKDLLN